MKSVNKKAATASASTSSEKKAEALFGKENYRLMIIGLVIIAIGFFLMAGGKSPDSNVFDEKSVYSPMRITVAPILIIAGLIIEIFAIMRKSK